MGCRLTRTGGLLSVLVAGGFCELSLPDEADSQSEGVGDLGLGLRGVFLTLIISICSSLDEASSQLGEVGDLGLDLY